MNNYAVSSDGIATALQDSASALMEAGNSLEQATALVAAANKVVQDPSSVGSALRTISLRLRGTSVEILEEMGEETDGVVESTSKLQEKLKALTGVDILTDAGAYKDTYTILKEIGEVWQDLDPMDQAAALELMAGKNRANTLAAILNNMEDLKGAYNSALGAEGSAMRENETYLDSIQGRIDLFNNSVQTMWMNFLNSDALKFIVDLGTGFIKLVDSVGVLKSLFMGLIGYLTFIKKTDWTKTLSFSNGFGSGKTKLLTGKALDNELTSFNNALEQGADAFATYKNNATKAGNGMDILADKVSNGTIQLKNGKASAQDYTVAVHSISPAAQQAATKQKLLNAAIGIGMIVITGIISAIQEYKDGIKTLDERYEELQNNISEAEGRISSFDSTLEEINEQIDELSGKSLTVVEAEELRRLKEKSKELESQKKIQEEILQLNKKQNGVVALQKINDLLSTTAANQQEAAESGELWGKIIGGVLGVATAVVGVALMATGAGAPIGAALTSGGAVALAGALGFAGSTVGGMIGESIGSNSKQVEEDLFAWYESYADAIKEAQQQATEAEVEYFSDMTDDNYDAWQKKLEAVENLKQELYTNLESIQSYVSDLEYNDSTKAMIDGFNGLLAKISLQNIGDDAQSQIAHIQSLEEEFNELSKGVDDNGKNIALTSQEYARYQTILSQILGLTPSLIQGYNDEGKAIVNKNSLIAESISLLQRQNKEAARSLFINDDSNILSTYASHLNTYDTKMQTAKNVANPFSDTNVYSIGDWNAFTIGESIISDVVRTAALSDPNTFIPAVHEYRNRGPNALSSYIANNADVVSQNLDTIIAEFASYEEFGNVDSEETAAFAAYLQQIITYVEYARMSTSQFAQTLAQIPQASDYYDDLSGSHLSFINAYIDSLGNLGTLTDQEVLSIRDNIYQLTNSIGRDEVAQDLINSLFEVDPNLAAQVYCDTIRGILQQISDIGLVDEDTKNKIFESLVPDAENITTMLTAVKDKLIDDYDSMADNLSIGELKIAYKFVNSKDPGTVTWQMILDEIAANQPENIVTVDIYSELVTQISKYKDILQQTSEIVSDNVMVTQEYKDSLKELGIENEDIEACFDDNNKLMVTNAKLLNDLVKTSKENVKGNVRLAKSQAQLKYYELYKEMRDLTQGTEITDGATLSYVDSLYAQMNAIEKTISKYSLLEAKLLGTTNAYEQLEAAQTLDSENDYGSKAEELVNVLANAFNTSELGTQAAQVAIDGLIPDEIIDKTKTLDEQMQQIYEYFTGGTVSKLFTIEFDDNGGISSVEMTKENVEEFTKSLMGEVGSDAVFQGTWDEFTLNPAIQTMEDFRKALGVTEEVAFAYLTELEKFDIGWLGGDYESLLDQLMDGDLEYAINKNIRDLADLEERAAHGEFVGRENEYNQRYAELTAESSSNQDAARASIAQWADATEQIDAAQSSVDTLSDELAELEKSDASSQEIQVKKDELQDAVQELYNARQLLNGLEEPTEVVLQIASEDIQSEIQTIEDQLAQEGVVIDSVVRLNTETGQYEVVENHRYTGTVNLENYADLLNENKEINTLLSEGITSTDQYLSNIDTTVSQLYSLFSKRDQNPYDNTENASDDTENDSDDSEDTSEDTETTSSGLTVRRNTLRQAFHDRIFADNRNYAAYEPTEDDLKQLDRFLNPSNYDYYWGDDHAADSQEQENRLEAMRDVWSDNKLNTANGWVKFISIAPMNEDGTKNPDPLPGLSDLLDKYGIESEGLISADITDKIKNAIENASNGKNTGEGVVEGEAQNITIVSDDGLEIETAPIDLNTETGNALQNAFGNPYAQLNDPLGLYSDNSSLNLNKAFNEIGVDHYPKDDSVYTPFWADAVDIVDWLKTMDMENEEIARYLQKLDGLKNFELINLEKVDVGLGGTKPQNFTHTPVVTGATMRDAGWTDVEEDGIVAFNPSVYHNEDGTKSIVLTPILPNGEVLSPEELQSYADKILNGEELDIDADIKLAEYNGNSSAELANQYVSNLFYRQKDAEDPLALYKKYAEAFESALKSLGIQYDKSIGTWFDGKDDIEFNITDLVTTLKEKGWTNEAIKAYCQKLSETEIPNINIEVDGIENIDSVLGATNNTTIEDKEFEVTANGAAKAQEDLKDIEDYKISDKSYEVKATYTKEYKTIGNTGTVRSSAGGGGRYTMADGTAHVNGTAYQGGSWGAPNTETALVGELGPEMVVRDGRWFTVGENGAEFTDIKKGDIIFNHRQTEDLLSKGYVTGRGKAYAEGTAYAHTRESGVGGANRILRERIDARNVTVVAQSDTNVATGIATVAGNVGGVVDTFTDTFNKLSEDYGNKGGNGKGGSGGGGKKDDAENEFNEIFDWIEVRLEEINESINLNGAKLENAIGSTEQNAIIDNMIGLNQDLYDNLIRGANEYYAYAAKLLDNVPEEYRKAAQNGKIAIEEFVGEVDEETLNAIQKYREWVQKGADTTQQAEEVLTEISNLAKQAIDNIAQEYENKASIPGFKIEQLEAYNALIETTQGAESAKIYQAMIKENNKQIGILQSQRQKMQAELNAQVEAGNIKKYSQAWYDAIGEIAEVDTEILNLTADTEGYQDTINELHWDHFDNLLSRFEAISDEAENLIDILSNKDLVDKDTAEWTDEGITSLGLYAQQMEVAEMQAKKYKEEIQYLNKNWKKLGYTEQEYVEKLEELKEGQYDAINAYNDTKDAIVDLTSERVDAIKEGIEKEIEAYEELIDKKKEELDAEKDLYDFQKGVANQQKEIADIERKLAALSADNSASARAKRAQLQAELLEAQQELEDTYYDRSISDQQEVLDKELEAFQEEKDKEIEGWEKYLEDTEAVVADGLATIQNNTDAVYNTLQEMGEEYSLSIADALTSPWKYGEDAIQSYSEKFKMDMSKTVEELKKIAKEHKQLIDEIEKHGNKDVGQVNNNTDTYTEAEPGKKGSNGGSAASMVSGLSGDIQYGQSGANVKKLQKALNALGFNCGSVDGIFGDKTYAAVMAFQKSSKFGGAISADGIVGPKTKKKFKVAGYAGGTTGVKNDQWALIDELGEELVIRPSKGRMTFMEKGTAVIPADLTANLAEWGELDPSIMLERNKPVISAPHVTNNNVEINMEFGEVVHIDTVTNDTIPNLTKAIEKQMDKYMKNVNNNIRKYAR